VTPTLMYRKPNSELRKILTQIKKALKADPGLSPEDVDRYMHKVRDEFVRSPGFWNSELEHAIICARRIIVQEAQIAA